MTGQTRTLPTVGRALCVLAIIMGVIAIIAGSPAVGVVALAVLIFGAAAV